MLNLKNHLLLAMPGLSDPNFSGSLIYVCEYSSEEGALGFTINEPSDIPMSRIFDEFQLDHPEILGQQPLLLGGPVQQERGFVLHRAGHKQWQATAAIGDDIFLTGSQDIIEDIAQNKGPDSSFITLGYAGWAPGQLEQEIADNSWLIVEADAEIIFDVPFQEKAQAAAQKLGIDLQQLSPLAGHA